MNTPVFEPISFADMTAALGENLTPVIYNAGARLFQQGEAGAYAYVIERGEVAITRESAGRVNTIAILGPGELVGEMSLIDNEPRSATATAVCETEVIPIGRMRLKATIDQAGPMVQLVLNGLIERLRNTALSNAASADDGCIGRGATRNRSIDAVRGRAIRQIKMETELRDAFARRELALYFQPIVRLKDCRIAGFEALLRWLSPARGIVPPNEFIGVAEQSGLIVPIGLWIIEHACHMLKRFQALREKHSPDEPPLFITVNVSARQLRDSANVDSMISTIRRTGIDPGDLKIEITEGLLIDDPEGAITAFNRMKSLGVSIALDDFGTGFSSLSYLHRFPLDTLKIDRSFVMSMLKSRDSMTVIRTITRLAQDLHLTCVSEGLEDPHELTTLTEFGCDFGQGYLFSRPVPENEVAALLARDRLWTPTRSATGDSVNDELDGKSVAAGDLTTSS